ncbi:glycosyltransferase family 4 protein [Phenylobacterium sp. 20VBR1]|uniref:Glycosyltransferase family 4 protein n=1 Tax=Phenylobacterium glaciei TaxID=2803784 RepID=A0A941D3K0_9CAUL|nr:glycosyltransferase family 4 protein [Phenylobacterium glaciei]MBR7621252.1 glycosyltransferase family 4 protein [Phenylobacterium glaciei]
MSNAAIFFHPDGYDTTGVRLMGRHSAGESFLRGFLRHADVERLHLFNASTRSPASLQPLLDRIQPSDRPVTWLDRTSRHRVADPGCLYLPQPTLAPEAWLRRPFGRARYSLCGITHTTATHRATDVLADMMTAPVEAWDALICTSDAVRSGVQVLLEKTREDLHARLGATRFPTPEITTIPLGVNASDFAPSPEQRSAWRARLDIPQDALVALYLGRFHAAGKMNPATMALALEAAAQSTGKPIYWIVAGWSATDETTAIFHRQTQAFCPSIHYRPVDGRAPDTRFSIWSAADFFISFSENVQETFGLTPVEAMAAGLPSVVTDWDGYRDTVRHGLDGFRIPTTAPRPGLGRDLAYHFANDWITYEAYLVAGAQMTGVDHAAAVAAISALVANPDLRRSMGESAARQARDHFDWSAIIPRYQALWAELAARRLAAQPEAPEMARIVDNPRRLDPFEMFATYPTSLLTSETRLRAVSGMSWDLAKSRLTLELGAIGGWALPSLAEAQAILTYLQAHADSAVADIVATFAVPRRGFVERGLLWLVKFGVIELVSPPSVANSTDS